MAIKLKGMILAAGQGTRVRPLTKDIPKPMIPILGKPVMEYLIEHLARHGVSEIMINVAHLNRNIEQYFGNGRRWGTEIGYSYEGVYDHGELTPKPLGSAGGMRHIQDFGGFFDHTTIVMCGDALIDLDIGAALFEHKQKKAMVSVITMEVPTAEVSNYGIVETDEDGRVISFQEKPTPQEARSNLASTGIYFFEPEAIDLIPPGKNFDIGSQLFPLLVEKGLPFYAQKRFYNWIDIGRISDYWEVLQRVLRGEISYMEMPGKEVRPGVWVGLNTNIDWDNVKIEGPVYIDSGTQIDAGAEIIGPCWISHGSHICKNAKVIRSVLFEYTRISADMTVSEMIVSPRYCVDRSGETYYVGDDRCSLRWGDARI
ncbi:NDP-sugar synthase [Methylotenera sp.]|uniref:NDP-sugar synthase n=1 Tax=Methylotenera sp. TaxID=2051956 RepID=UPI002731CBA9|nr:NDP-sugar synthase [Methylotenera sp.]MDP2071860.1 NDP-sugar synthase [Methylotenera sp.]MDP3005485.1 NDP-sugar synthase [Methylotenera sp.]